MEDLISSFNKGMAIVHTLPRRQMLLTGHGNKREYTQISVFLL